MLRAGFFQARDTESLFTLAAKSEPATDFRRSSTASRTSFFYHKGNSLSAPHFGASPLFFVVSCLSMSIDTKGEASASVGSFLQSLTEIIFTILKWLFGVVVLAFVVWWLLPADWRIKYASEYMLDPEQVAIEHKPHDCDWDSAPLGNKHCHYEEFVTVFNRDGKIIETSFGKTDPEPLDQTAAKAHVEWRRIVE
jgi:hypothetical protein